MPSKRSRICRNSSSGVFNETRSSESRRVVGNPADGLKFLKSASKEADRARPSIMEISPLVKEPVPALIGNSLEKCYRCKRKIGDDDAIFMYSSHAFCTFDCRDYQIDVDKLAEEASQQSKLAKSMSNATRI